MSSWPWMKGIDVAIADAIPPINEYDKRLSVKDLIAANREKIDKVKSNIETEKKDPTIIKLYDPKKHDDLWILRFVLSHKKNTKKATKAIKTTLLFREEYKLDEVGDIREHPPGPNVEQNKLMHQYFDEDTFNVFLPDPKRGLVAIFRLAGVDQHSLVKNVDESKWLPHFMYFSEFSHQWLDYITRTTGRLTQQARIIDLGDLQMSQISMEMNRRDGRAMGTMEDCYPQLLQKLVICNSPSWIQIPFRIARPLLPKRVIQKMDFVVDNTTEKERKKVLEFISEEHLPERFGGKNPTWPVEFNIPETN